MGERAPEMEPKAPESGEHEMIDIEFDDSTQQVDMEEVKRALAKIESEGPATLRAPKGNEGVEKMPDVSDEERAKYAREWSETEGEATGVIDIKEVRKQAEPYMKNVGDLAVEDEPAPETKRGAKPFADVVLQVADNFARSVKEGKPMRSSEMVNDLTFWLETNEGTTFKTAEVLSTLKDALKAEANKFTLAGDWEGADAVDARIEELAAAYKQVTEGKQ